MNKKLYHGTNQYFEMFEQSKSRIPNDFYGGGVAYFTSDIDVAYTYANNMVKSKGGDRYVIEVELRINKLFDVNDPFPQAELGTLFGNLNEIEEFARGAGLLKYGVERMAIIGALQSNVLLLTMDQVFKGLSKGMNRTATARDKLKKLGYDTLRYNGGSAMGGKTHDVFIAYKASNITIKKRYLFDPQGNKYERS